MPLKPKQQNVIPRTFQPQDAREIGDLGETLLEIIAAAPVTLDYTSGSFRVVSNSQTALGSSLTKALSNWRAGL